MGAISNVETPRNENTPLAMDFIVLPPQPEAPAKPQEGMLAVCDGSTWDPLGGGEAGLVIYINGAWAAASAA